METKEEIKRKGRTPFLEKPVAISIIIEEADKEMLQKQGIVLNSFFRQAIDAFKENKFDYEYLLQ